jgi:type IV secretory pathway protease TraF
MQKIIDDYEKKIGEKPNEITKIVNSPCTIDGEFSGVVRRLDALGRPAKSTRGSVKFR